MLLSFAHFAQLIVFPVCAFVFSLFGTWLCIRLFPLIGLMDIPEGRHIHQEPTPRGGGVAIAIAFFAGLGLYLVSGMGQLLHPTASAAALKFLIQFAPPALVILLLGLADDRWNLKSYVKLFVQILVAAYIWWNGYGVNSLLGFHLPAWASILLTVLWIAGVINAYNLIDGLDGVAAGLAAVSSFCIALWLWITRPEENISIIILIFFASCLGFLKFNFHPAQIFMGDAGSMFIGMFLAFVSLQEVTKTISFASMLLPVLAIGLPLFDEVLAIWRRFIRKRIHQLDQKQGLRDDLSNVGIMTGDRDHLHHRLLQMRGSQSRAAWTMYALAILAFLWAVGIALLESFLPALMYFLILAGIFFAVSLANIELRDSFNLAVRGFRIPRKSITLTMLHPLMDAFLFSISFFIAGLFSGYSIPNSQFIVILLVFFTPFMIQAAYCRLYRIYWLRAGVNRFFALARTLILSGIIGYILLYVLYRTIGLLSDIPIRTVSEAYLLMVLMVLTLICGERFFLMYLEGYGIRSFYLRNSRRCKEKLKRTLIYGGGIGCRLYLHFVYGRYHLYEPFEIVGIVDDDPALFGLYVHGFRVIGALGDLEHLYKRKSFESIVVTVEHISEDSMKALQKFCTDHPVKLTFFTVGEMDFRDAVDDGLLTIKDR